MRAFELTSDMAEAFFSICLELNLNTEPERVNVLNMLAKEGLVKRVWDTERSKEDFIKDMAKHYKVLHVKSDSKVEK